MSTKIISPVSIESVPYDEKARFFTGIPEFDRVLGGIVEGQAILLSGEPGIGKSTLVLGIANKIAEKKKVFYVNGEESNSQVKLRARRMKTEEKNLYLFSENKLDNIIHVLRTEKPDALFVDSIQTLFSERYASLPGSLVQIRESCHELVQFCKSENIPLFLVGHITKSGIIAGPKIVEHMVDTVLFLESDSRGNYRILRSLKNRFAAVDEAGFFTMEENGMEGIQNISCAFIFGHENSASGVSLYPHLEGNRVFPVEIQALAVPSQFNYPKRTADGMDTNRLFMLIAIMEKSLKVNFSAHDVYVNVTSGLKVKDPSLDLSVILALYSSLKDKPSPLDTAAFGEAGLSGEVRPVQKAEKRAQEMARLGIKSIVLPHSGKTLKSIENARLLPVKTITEAISAVFDF